MHNSNSPRMMAWDVSHVEKSDDDSSIDNISNPDSAIDMAERHTSLSKSSKKFHKDSSSKRTTTVKLPDLFTSVAAQPARLNPFWKSDVPREADEWART